METDTGEYMTQQDDEMTLQSLKKLRHDVTGFLDELDNFLCGGEIAKPKIELGTEVKEEKMQEFNEKFADGQNEEKPEKLPMASDRRLVVITNNTEIKPQLENEVQARTKLEPEATIRERIKHRTKERNIETKAILEVSKIKKRKLKIVSENEPRVQRLVLPVKRKKEFDTRQSIGKRFKTQADDNTSGSFLSSACVPVVDLRQVLQRRRGLCC